MEKQQIIFKVCKDKNLHSKMPLKTWHLLTETVISAIQWEGRPDESTAHILYLGRLWRLPWEGSGRASEGILWPSDWLWVEGYNQPFFHQEASFHWQHFHGCSPGFSNGQSSKGVSTSIYGYLLNLLLLFIYCSCQVTPSDLVLDPFAGSGNACYCSVRSRSYAVRR